MQKKQIGIDEVHFPKDTSSRLVDLTNLMRKITVILFSYLIVMAVIVLSSTTLFKIAMKKDEIELLRLLGASDIYIQKPYLLEGLFFGLMAAIFSFIVVVGLLFYLNPFLVSYLKGIPTLAIQTNGVSLTVWPINKMFLLITFTFSALFGMGIAFFASFVATRKYLS